MEYIHGILTSTVDISGVAVILLGFIAGVSVSINVIQTANTRKLTEMCDSWKYQAKHLQAELNASHNGQEYDDEEEAMA